MKDYINQRCTHIRYGSGTIISQNSKIIEVIFDDIGEKKKFAYPSCFEKFITLVDSEVQLAAKSQAAELENQNLQQAKRREEEKRAQQFRERHEDELKEMFDIPQNETLSSFSNHFKSLVLDGIQSVRMHPKRKYKLRDGRLIKRQGGEYIYSYDLEDNLQLPEDQVINLYISANGIYIVNDFARVISCEDFEITFSTLVDLSANLKVLEISSSLTWLLEATVERLEELSESHSPIATELVTAGKKHIINDNSLICIGQDTAREMATHQQITFIWGPPGTGKTEVLARIGSDHLKQNHRILLVSTANTAVDGAALRLIRMGDKDSFSPGQIIRYGFPKDRAVTEHPYLWVQTLLETRYPEVFARKKKLIELRKDASNTDDHIKAELSKINLYIKELTAGIVENAQFIATSIAKAKTDKLICKPGNFDVVIFDEISMALIPEVAILANLCKKTFIGIGDFRQLAPIAQSGEIHNELISDMFNYCGIHQAVDSGCSHEWLCMLDTQYRMHRDIATFISRSSYKNKLKTATGISEKRIIGIESKPLSGFPVGILDLSGMMTVCRQTAEKSRFNILSAFISVIQIIQAKECVTLGIITPYNAQSRLLKAITRDLEDNGFEKSLLECSTVHSFQGSEKDIILFDLVECYLMPSPGVLVTGITNGTANRLFNVAMSRAKCKFICVANLLYLSRKKLSRKLALTDFIHRLKSEAYTPEMYLNTAFTDYYGFSIFTDSRSATRRFFQDIKSAKKTVYLDIPDPINKRNSYSPLVEVLFDYRDHVKTTIRAQNVENLPEEFQKLKPIEDRYNPRDPIAIIDDHILWYGQPLTDSAFLIGDKVEPALYRPIIRFTGKHTIALLYDFLHIE